MKHLFATHFRSVICQKYLILCIIFILCNVSVNAGTWYVNDGSTAGDVYTGSIGNNANSGSAAFPFATISFAIGVASAGDTIMVDAGNYASGDIFITKRLVIRGAKSGIPAWPDPMSVRGSNESNIAGAFYFGANTDSIAVDGFSINIGTNLRGIESRGLRTIIINNIVTGSVNIFTQQQGISTRSNAAVRTHSYLIKNNKVTNLRTGIYMDGGRDLPSEISYNFVSGCFTAGYTFTASNGHTIRANISDNNGTGMLITKGRNLIEKNTIINNTSIGIRIAATDSTFDNLIQNNFINNNGVGISLTEDNAASVNNKAYFNSIVANTSSISNANSANFDAKCNWFGTTVSAAIAATITGDVTFIPYLTDGTDTDPVEDGFQPSATCSVVPLNLLSFEASGQQKTVVLFWKTNAEVNSSHFIIQRSYDQIQFQNIGTVNARGGRYENNYSFIDDAVTQFGKPVFYRLQIVDLDGSYARSNIRSVQINVQGFYVQQIFPNPVKSGNDIQLKIYADKLQQSSLSIINSKGQLVLNKNILIRKGNQEIRLPIPFAFSGSYIVKIISGNDQQNVQLFVH